MGSELSWLLVTCPTGVKGPGLSSLFPGEGGGTLWLHLGPSRSPESGVPGRCSWDVGGGLPRVSGGRPARPRFQRHSRMGTGHRRGDSLVRWAQEGAGRHSSWRQDAEKQQLRTSPGTSGLAVPQAPAPLNLTLAQPGPSGVSLGPVSLRPCGPHLPSMLPRAMFIISVLYFCTEKYRSTLEKPTFNSCPT